SSLIVQSHPLFSHSIFDLLIFSFFLMFLWMIFYYLSSPFLMWMIYFVSVHQLLSSWDEFFNQKILQSRISCSLSSNRGIPSCVRTVFHPFFDLSPKVAANFVGLKNWR